MVRMASPALEDSTRHRLIESARTLFTLGSYSSVGVQELCEHADIRRGSFYYHFASKRELALAALDAEWAVLRADVFEPAFAGDPSLESLEVFQKLLGALQRSRAEEIGGFGGCLTMTLVQEMAPIDEAIRSRAMQHLELWAGYFERVVAAAAASGAIVVADPVAGAQRISTYVQGMLAAARAQSDPGVIEQMAIALERVAAD